MNQRILPLFLAVFLAGGGVVAETKAALSPADALVLLKAGNQRFLDGTLLHPHQDAARRVETAKGQAPFAAVLGCADSRESLDAIFDAGIGDLFTIRVAGNVADVDEIASLEYGAEHLHTPLIVVLGHTSCGAVTAVVSKAELGGQLPGLLDNIQAPAARALASFGAGAKDLVDQTARENVLQSIQDMLVRSKILSELVEKGELRIVGGLYHLDTGAVEWMESLPSLESWTSVGLKGVAEGESTTGAQNPLIPALLSLLLSALLLGLFQKSFVSENRFAPGLKLKARLTLSYVGLLLTMGAGAVVTFVLSDPWPLGVATAVSAVFLVLFTRSHFATIKAFIRGQRK